MLDPKLQDELERMREQGADFETLLWYGIGGVLATVIRDVNSTDVAAAPRDSE